MLETKTFTYESCQKYIHPILTTYHADIVLSSSLSLNVLHTLCGVCMQKIGEVEFCKHRVKIQIWGKPVIFLMSYVCK